MQFNDIEKSQHNVQVWLRKVMTETGLKATPLAKKCGLSPTTILRALDPADKNLTSLKTIERIVQGTGMPPPQYNSLSKSNENIHQSGFSEPELVTAENHQGFTDQKTTASQAIWQIKNNALTALGYMPGDYILADSTLSAADQDIVVAQIYNMATGSAETVIRLYDQPYLVTRSADPSQNSKPQLVDNERVMIWGVVIKSIRERQHGRPAQAD